jgi:hypothetical protein
MLGWARVMTALRTVRQPWPNPQARDALAPLLRASGFGIRSDDHHVFTLAVDSPGAARLLVDALYLPRLTPPRAAAAQRALTRWARPGRRLQLPLRRVVADLPATRSTVR